MKYISLLFQSLLSIALIEQAGAAIYENDFSTTGFTTETAGADWTVSSGAYQNVFTGNNATSSASVVVEGINGTSFTMSSRFTVNSFNPGTTTAASTLGFGLMGSDATFSGPYYLADFGYGYDSGATTKGGLRILALGDSTGFTTSSTANNFDGNTTNLAIQEDVTYTLMLTGTYNGSGHLDLSLGLFDSTGTTQFGTSATATDLTPLLGTNFGYRNRNGSNSSTASNLNASFDNFAVIPEPSSLALLFIALTPLIWLRRGKV
jgi:hypothetical protein